MPFLPFFAIGQPLSAYKLSQNGKEVEWAYLVKKAADADVVFFDETHNSHVSHWLELELTKALIEKGKLGALGLEMLETDDADLLEEYLKSQIKQEHFKASANLWNNYEADYEPLVELAKDSGLPVIATNCPRRYASLVARKGLAGLEELSPAAKATLAPLPIRVPYDQPSYKAMLGDETNGHGAMGQTFVEAQALKDATMAYQIKKHLPRKGKVFLHVNGSYHSDHWEGIVTYLKQYESALKLLVISCYPKGEAPIATKPNDFLVETAF